MRARARPVQAAQRRQHVAEDEGSGGLREGAAVDAHAVLHVAAEDELEDEGRLGRLVEDAVELHAVRVVHLRPRRRGHFVDQMSAHQCR